MKKPKTYVVLIEETNVFSVEVQANSDGEAVSKASVAYRDSYDAVSDHMVGGEVDFFSQGVKQ